MRTNLSHLLRPNSACTSLLISGHARVELIKKIINNLPLYFAYQRYNRPTSKENDNSTAVTINTIPVKIAISDI